MNDQTRDDPPKKDETTDAGSGSHHDVAATETPAESLFGEAEHHELEEHSSETIARLERDVTEMKEQLLRALAESENIRRRSQKEVADAKQYAITGFARDILGVADNFRRALESLPEESRIEEAGLKGVVDGIRMTERELSSVLDRHGIKIVDPTGERFDPNLHQAMFEVENTEVTSGTVVQVVQPGAVLGERIVRPALVGVSKGGPKPAPKQPEPATSDEGDGASDG